LKSSCQARFTEQEQADRKQQLIDISIQHQILSPFTAFIGIETRTEQEIAAVASSGEMILREVPIEIRDAGSLPIGYDTSVQFTKRCRNVKMSRAASVSESSTDDDSEDEEDCEDDSSNSSSSCRVLKRKKYHAMSISRSRSRSLLRRRASSPSDIENMDDESLPEDKNDDNPTDIIRQIIGLQNFSGIWSIKDLKRIISLLQQSTVSTVLKDVNLEEILNDYKDKDNDLILSIIIMFIFEKYFTDDQPLWKPLMKKCVKAMENRLGNEEYNEITDKIKKVV
jgi:hypothetical protein